MLKEKLQYTTVIGLRLGLKTKLCKQLKLYKARLSFDCQCNNTLIIVVVIFGDGMCLINLRGGCTILVLRLKKKKQDHFRVS